MKAISLFLLLWLVPIIIWGKGINNETKVSFPKAEYKEANLILMHTPQEELFMGILHPDAALFQDYFDYNLAAKEHKEYIKELEKNGAKVVTVRSLMENAPIDSLRKLANNAISYFPMDSINKGIKRIIINQLSKEELIKAILLRPTITTSSTISNTGVKAKYELEPLMNLFFMRDQSITTPRGPIIGRMNSTQRKFETEITEFCLTQLGFKPIYKIKGDSSYLEGGDYIPFGTISLIGCGMRTNKSAIKELMNADAFGHDTIVVVKDKKFWQAQMHLDTYFNILDKDLVTLSAERLNAIQSDKEYLVCDIYARKPNTKTYQEISKDNSFVSYLNKRGLKIIGISWQDAMNYGNNFLTIAPKKIMGVAGQSDSFIKTLKDNGITATWIPLYNLTMGYGGPHCMTQVILRNR